MASILVAINYGYVAMWRCSKYCQCWSSPIRIATHIAFEFFLCIWVWASMGVNIKASIHRTEIKFLYSNAVLDQRKWKCSCKEEKSRKESNKDLYSIVVTIMGYFQSKMKSISIFINYHHIIYSYSDAEFSFKNRKVERKINRGYYFLRWNPNVSVSFFFEHHCSYVHDDEYY